MRRLIALSLATLIVLTSQQMAAARAMMLQGGTDVVLCTGQGTITVTLDADGNLTDTPPLAHICPDCVIALADTTTPPHGAMGEFVHMQTIAQRPEATLQTRLIPKSGHARAPPVSV